MKQFILLLLAIIPSVLAQKLVVVIAEGLGGSYYHKFSHLSGLRTFEEEGVWSTKLHPVFPTLPLPNRHSLLTGALPRRHGMIGDYVYNWRTGNKFYNFTEASDYDHNEWWSYDPIYVLATRARASVAMFFFPECNIDWMPSPHLCRPPSKDGISFSDEIAAKEIVQATKTHDLILVYHPNIREEIERLGPRKANDKTAKEVDRFQQSLERLTAQARERIDLNVMVISPHGLTDVHRKNIRVLDDYLPMELLNTSIGSGAVKQLLAKTGKTHQVYSQLRHHNPIPNVKIYYTAPKIGDMPEWYHYKKSATVTDLVLIAMPGYAIVTRDAEMQFPPPHAKEIRHGVSGYNNQYPDMLGVFLAYGPVFKKGFSKGPIELCDIYSLMCALLKLECMPTPGRILRIDDILKSEARVAIRSHLNTGTNHMTIGNVFLPLIAFLLVM